MNSAGVKRIGDVARPHPVPLHPTPPHSNTASIPQTMRIERPQSRNSTDASDATTDALPSAVYSRGPPQCGEPYSSFTDCVT